VLLTGAGLVLPQVAAAGAVLGVAWLVNSVWLGKRQDQLARANVGERARTRTGAVSR